MKETSEPEAPKPETPKPETPGKDVKSVTSDSYAPDYADYHWGEEESEQEIPEVVSNEPDNKHSTQNLSAQNKPQVVADVAVTEKLQKPTETDKDPLASLHAALGLVASEEESKAFSPTVEAELEETRKDIPPLEESSEEETSLSEEVRVNFDSEQADADAIYASLMEQADTVELEDEAHVEDTVSGAEIEQEMVQPASLQENTGLKFEPVHDDEWTNLTQQLGLDGTAYQITLSSLMDWTDEDKIQFRVKPTLDMICTDSAKATVEAAVIKYLDKTVKFDWQFAEPDRETPSMVFERLAKEKHQKACKSLREHAFSQEIQKIFAAELIPESVSYLD